MLTSTRFAAAAALFYNVKITRVMVQPYDLAAAQYVEWAVECPHVPYLASTGDVVPSAPTSVSKVLTLPSARVYQQGNGPCPALGWRLSRLSQCQVARITTDLPTVLYLFSYSTADVKWNLFFRCKFSDYIPSV